MNDSASATIARACWRTLEPYHGMIYFVPEAADRYSAVGLEGRSGYFASRCAAMGAVSPLVVQATFFNFDPGLVERSMGDVWDRVTPAQVLAARHDAVDAALVRLLGDEVSSDDIVRAVERIRPAVDAAIARPEGRPLFAGHAGIPEPEPPHVALWWAITLLREFRGDGHIAALVDAELSGLDALILHGASGEVEMELLRSTRGWSSDHWAAGIEELQSRGLVGAGHSLTDAGRELRERIESRTDALAASAWAALDPESAQRIRALVRPFSRAISAAVFSGENRR